MQAVNPRAGYCAVFYDGVIMAFDPGDRLVRRFIAVDTHGATHAIVEHEVIIRTDERRLNGLPMPGRAVTRFKMEIDNARLTRLDADNFQIIESDRILTKIG